MSFSQTSGTAIVPTLSRLVLCVAFVAAGWSKCFKEATFNDEQAVRLTALGVTVTSDGTIAGVTVRPHAELTGFQEADTASDREVEQEGDGETTDATTDDPQDAVPPPTEPETSVDPDTLESAPLNLAGHRARAVHRITLLVDGAGWPEPVLMAWLAGVTELLGGALLLVGLFSRVWGLGLGIAMGVAFYLTTFQGLSMDVFDLSNGANIPKFNTMFSQVGLGVLAFGILLTGPGPLSLDRRLFGRGEDVDEPVRILADD